MCGRSRRRLRSALVARPRCRRHPVTGRRPRGGTAVCGTVSAIGLTAPERQRWPELRERLREPGHCMALMRGVLGDTEVAAVAAVTPDGTVRTLAIMASPQE